MYPELHVRGMTFSMTGLGIVSFLILFIRIIKTRCTNWGLQFREFLRFLPMMILLAYFLGTRSRYLLSDFIIFPIQPERWLLYLTPYEYHFHFSGIVLGLLIGWYKFLKNQPRETHLQRYHAIFEGMLLATIPLGIFLLFGDHFIGKPTESMRYVSAIDPLSKVAAYDKVIPLGFYLSAGCGLLYLVTSFLYQRKPGKNVIFLGYILYRLGIGILLIWQIYPRHLVMKLRGVTIDIKQYTCLAVILLICWQWILFTMSSQRTKNETHETHPLT